MSATAHKHTILYAEDDLDDLMMVEQAFQQYDANAKLLHAKNGCNALEELKALHAADHLPCLIILDINMPGMNGKEALVRIKQTEDFKNIPVVLFTTSSTDGDKEFAKKWGARFITKPLVYAELEELAKAFLHICTSKVSETA